MDTFTKLADDATIQKTVSALIANGITALVVKDGGEAKEKVLSMIPEHAEVMTMTSLTLQTTGLINVLNESGKYDAIRPKLMKMDRKTQGREMQRMGAAPEWAIGSVHAVTEDGHVLIASGSGSQLPGYSYGSAHVIWVVGIQKIVKDVQEGIKRIYEYVLPLESKRMQQVYGFGSNVNKLLIFNKEIMPQRVTLIFVKEALGF